MRAAPTSSPSAAARAASARRSWRRTSRPSWRRLGLRVAAVDTDLEGANLHTWLGVPRPATSLADFVAGRESDVAKLLVETPIANLALVAATQGHLGSAHPRARAASSCSRGCGASTATSW